MLNIVTIMGRLTREPELRKTANAVSVASFTLAVDRDFANKEDGKRECDFIDCVAWRGTADFVQKYFRKGSMAVVNGRLQIRNYEDKDGNKRRAAEVIADHVYFGSSSKDAAETAKSDTDKSVARDNEKAEEHQTFVDLSNEDDADLPF